MAGATRIRRQTSLTAAQRIQEQLREDSPERVQITQARAAAVKVSSRPKRAPPGRPSRDASTTRVASPSPNANEDEYRVHEDADSDDGARAPKRRKIAVTAKGPRPKAPTKWDQLFGPQPELDAGTGVSPWQPCDPHSRVHPLSYHRPLLLAGPRGRAARAALLSWFDGVSTLRGMPWRKPWIDPSTYSLSSSPSPPYPPDLRAALERRAYEVWVSEVMLQQTRVAVAAGYWDRWVRRWPTVHDLAAAHPDDVLAAWRGLGYYGRARRLHEAARKVVADPGMRGLLPAEAATLEAEVPGVGRYTAGAISAIVFGRAAPMVDGNVLRVLSRQMGVLGDVKTDRAVIGMLWAAADALVRCVALDTGDDGGDDEPAAQGSHGDDTMVSDRPGRWGQALMELGSTICTPKPDCASCPITSTCRAYQEGYQLAVAGGRVTESPVDIEDLCTLCEPWEIAEAADEAVDEEAAGKPKSKSTVAESTKKKTISKQLNLSAFAFGAQKGDGEASGKTTSSPSDATLTAVQLERIVEHARKFPLKVIKGPVREEETLVCAIRRDSGDYLIQRRPEKGLLAGLWEFPSYILKDETKNEAQARRKMAVGFVGDLFGRRAIKAGSRSQLRYSAELGSVPWLFSHLKLTMHVQLFRVDDKTAESLALEDSSGRPRRWASADSVEKETMGTGIRLCWALVKKVAATKSHRRSPSPYNE